MTRLVFLTHRYLGIALGADHADLVPVGHRHDVRAVPGTDARRREYAHSMRSIFRTVAHCRRPSLPADRRDACASRCSPAARVLRAWRATGPEHWDLLSGGSPRAARYRCCARRRRAFRRKFGRRRLRTCRTAATRPMDRIRCVQPVSPALQVRRKRFERDRVVRLEHDR